MSVKRIIQESLDKNPLGVKEALEEALQDRVRAALEEKYAEMTESKDEDDDDDDDDDDEDMDESFDLSDLTLEELEDFMMSESNKYDNKHVEHGLKLYRKSIKDGAMSSEAEGMVAHTAQKKFGFSSKEADKFASHIGDRHAVLAYASGPRSSLDRENMHGAIKRTLRTKK